MEWKTYSLIEEFLPKTENPSQLTRRLYGGLSPTGLPALMELYRQAGILL